VICVLRFYVLSSRWCFVEFDLLSAVEQYINVCIIYRLLAIYCIRLVVRANLCCGEHMECRWVVIYVCDLVLQMGVFGCLNVEFEPF
jgi:hypothetical protein